MELKTSFKGRGRYRNKRETYVCKCGYSTIKETEREEAIRTGKESGYINTKKLWIK